MVEKNVTHYLKELQYCYGVVVSAAIISALFVEYRGLNQFTKAREHKK